MDSTLKNELHSQEPDIANITFMTLQIDAREKALLAQKCQKTNTRKKFKLKSKVETNETQTRSLFSIGTPFPFKL